MTIDYHIIIGDRLSASDYQHIKDLIFNTFREVDNIYNKWNPQSEISQLNQLKAGEMVSLSPQLEKMLFLTNAIVKLTSGKFDPTIEPLQQLWKNHLDKGVIPSEKDIQSIWPAIGWHHLHFGYGKFFKDHDRTRLDLGGIVKGYCVDLLVERIVDAGFQNVLVEWGGELRANGIHPDKRPWIIMAGDDIASQNVIEIILDNQSVATSGDCMQYWKVYQNEIETTFFHIIDPQTATPLIASQTGVASATVVAPTCVLADALATSVMMHSTPAEAYEWTKKISDSYPELKFWLFSRDRSEPLQITTLDELAFSAHVRNLF